MGAANDTTIGDAGMAAHAPAAGRPVVPGQRRLGRYELGRELGRGATGAVYDARDTESDATVALKTLVSMDAENLFRLKHEFRSLANLEHDNFVRFGELSCDDGQWFFTMERVRGTHFLDYVRPSDSPSGARPDRAPSESHVRAARPQGAEHEAAGRRLDERRLRGVLAQLVEALAALHEAGRLHCDIKPSNVLVTTEGRTVLLDFGLTRGFGLNDRIAGTPAYMAPEQIDFQALTPAADWYAVGVMLFAALTGKLPFEGESGDILYAKITGDAPTDWGRGAPEDLRALCAALLEREPRARPGIDEIRSRLGLAPASRTALRDVFVGREAELERLRQALSRARSGASHVVVRGEPGMGKSALVERFLSELPARTLVLRGRCYEQETIPFGGVDALVDSMSEYLSGLTPDEVDRVTVGGVSNVARVFPVLCRVPHIAAQLATRAVDNPALLREPAFHEFGRLLRALSRSEPLVIFLDDLQWVDSDSLALARQAILSSGARCLFLATLRSSADLSPELSEMVSSLDIVDIVGLSPDESRALWETLGAAGQGDVRDAALRQAQGHPLLLAELLRSTKSGRFAVSTRLEDVLWTRISQRDAVDRGFLEMVSLAGAPTEYSVIARAADLDVSECLARLAALRAAQLVRVSRIGHERRVEPYHDRIREALLERIEDGQVGRAAQLHLRLGHALLAATLDTELPSRVFSVVQHMNLGRARVDSPREWKRLAELNLLASQQALLTTAFESARQYAAMGVECLERLHGQDAWSREAQLCRELHLARLQGEYRTGQRGRASHTFDIMKRRVRDPVARSEAYVTWVDLNGSHDPRAAIEAGREILRELGVPLPGRATPLHVLAQYALTRRAQRGRTAEQLRSLSPLRDESVKSALRILVALAPPAFMEDANLLPWIMMRIAHISMERGLSEASPYGFAGYGMVLTGAFGKHVEAASFGALASELAAKDKNRRIVARAHLLNAAFIVPWVGEFERSREAIEKSFELARVYGDTEYQVYSRTFITYLGLSMGSNVHVAAQWADRNRELAVLYDVRTQAELAECLSRYFAALCGRTASLADLSQPGSRQEDFLASLKHDSSLFCVHVTLAELTYLADDQGRAEAHMSEVLRQIGLAFATPLMVDMVCLSALVAARGCDGASVFGRLTRVAQIGRAARKLDAWARSCPANFESHAQLVRAELLRVTGRATKATEAYERAIATARTYETPKREAIAWELAARHAGALGNAPAAKRYLQQAIDAYRRWGATAKADALETS